MSSIRRCVLDDSKYCTECGECDLCDLDPNKICNNCMQCVSSTGADYLAVEIDDIVMDEADPEADSTGE